MKKLALFIAIPCIIFSGCKTQQKATTENYDDVYYSRPKLAQSVNKDAGSSQDLSAPKYVTPPDSSSSVKSGSAASKTDNSDYSYSARLKRFHDPVGQLGYYDNYYTNASNSDSTSGSSQVNVFVGSPWGPSYWDPFFSMGWGYGGWGLGWGWGYPYDWYYPYYYWGPDCYCCGYYGLWGSHPYWDLGYGGSYYGRRSTLFSTNGTRNLNMRATAPSTVSGQTRNNYRNPTGSDTRSTVNPPYSRTSEASRSIAGNGTKTGTNGTPSQRGTINPVPKPPVNRVPADQQHYNYKRNNVQKSSVYPRSTSKNAQGQRAVPRYVKPESVSPSRSGQAQIYSSPAYRQPKSSQEYINPRNQEIQNSGNNATRNYSSPINNSRRSGGGNTRTYSSPSNNNRNTYTAPARTFNPGYSSPSRSGNYSAPSRSGGGSYSAPSRSSGSSGGGNSGGGNSGSGGGRRK